MLWDISSVEVMISLLSDGIISLENMVVMATSVSKVKIGVLLWEQITEKWHGNERVKCLVNNQIRIKSLACLISGSKKYWDRIFSYTFNIQGSKESVRDYECLRFRTQASLKVFKELDWCTRNSGWFMKSSSRDTLTVGSNNCSNTEKYVMLCIEIIKKIC